MHRPARQVRLLSPDQLRRDAYDRAGELQHLPPFVAEAAKDITDHPSYLVLDLDGRRIEDLARYRQVTAECFDMGARTEPRIRVFPSAANGYYVMLRPLSPGKHMLNFGGVLPGMSQAVTYTLIVK